MDLGVEPFFDLDLALSYIFPGYTYTHRIGLSHCMANFWGYEAVSSTPHLWLVHCTYHTCNCYFSSGFCLDDIRSRAPLWAHKQPTIAVSFGTKGQRNYPRQFSAKSTSVMHVLFIISMRNVFSILPRQRCNSQRYNARPRGRVSSTGWVYRQRFNDIMRLGLGHLRIHYCVLGEG